MSDIPARISARRIIVIFVNNLSSVVRIQSAIDRPSGPSDPGNKNCQLIFPFVANEGSRRKPFVQILVRLTNHVPIRAPATSRRGRLNSVILESLISTLTHGENWTSSAKRMASSFWHRRSEELRAELEAPIELASASASIYFLQARTRDRTKARKNLRNSAHTLGESYRRV